MPNLHAQTAVEYLSTYLWALVIIAVTLSMLYYFGVFNAYNFTAKAQPGSCQVTRPYGPNTTAYISLQGTCNNQIPQYVAQFSGTGSISVNAPAMNVVMGGYDTIAFWMYWTGSASEEPFAFTSNGAYDISFPSPANCFGFSTNQGDLYGINSLALTNRWVFVATEVYNGIYTGNSLLYINGAKQSLSQCSGSAQSGYQQTSFYIGGIPGSTTYDFKGKLSNLQIYNITFTSNAVAALYQEGIGGVPINLQNLVGWWPLNGNSNDYSGNMDPGTTNSVSYSNSWYNAYSPP